MAGEFAAAAARRIHDNSRRFSTLVQLLLIIDHIIKPFPGLPAPCARGSLTGGYRPNSGRLPQRRDGLRQICGAWSAARPASGGAARAREEAQHATTNLDEATA